MQSSCGNLARSCDIGQSYLAFQLKDFCCGVTKSELTSGGRWNLLVFRGRCVPKWRKFSRATFSTTNHFINHIFSSNKARRLAFLRVFIVVYQLYKDSSVSTAWIIVSSPYGPPGCHDACTYNLLNIALFFKQRVCLHTHPSQQSSTNGHSRPELSGGKRVWRIYAGLQEHKLKQSIPRHNIYCTTRRDLFMYRIYSTLRSQSGSKVSRQ